MVNAGLMTYWLEAYWSHQGRRWFRAYYAQANFNDVIVVGRPPAALLVESQDCNLKITRFSVGYVGQIGVVLDPILVGNSYLQPHTTALASEWTNYDGIEIPIQREALTATSDNFVRVYPTGYLATDDIALEVLGYIESTQVVPHAQPVTVEGYRWPLKRSV